MSWGLCESFDASILNKFLSRYCNHYQYNMYISLKGKRFRLQVFFWFLCYFFRKKVASKEAPAVFDAVWKQGLLRLICILPGLLLMSLGFWWGHEHWTKLTSKTGEATPYVLGLPFGETNSADVAWRKMGEDGLVHGGWWG